MHPCFIASSENAVRLHLVGTESFEDWTKGESGASMAGFLTATGFKAQAGQLALVPNKDGALADAVFGLGDGDDALATAAAAVKLPEGDYEIASNPDGFPMSRICAGWTDGAYVFTRYKERPSPAPRLVVADEEERQAASLFAQSADFTRDLVNTPAGDMGPVEIAEAAAHLAHEFGGQARIVVGDALLEENYPMVHAVGRAADQQPRYAELSWGDESAPKLAIVGKGVAFDSGGLNIKTGNYMRLMKKDMGGAAHALGLARMVMASGLNVRLSVHIPTVENAVSAGAFRPGDVLESRKGLTVEIDNTDAEGRLILADALTRACELEPDLVLDFATLTGAARVAMGAEVVPYFTHDDDLAHALDEASAETGDPIWRLPLWKRYQAMLKSSVADVANGADSPFGGSITAGLFLDRFVTEGVSWAHFDLWAWRNAAYGRPAGGAAMTLRACFDMLKTRYG